MYKLPNNYAYYLRKRVLFYGSVILATVILMTLDYNSNYLSYYNCMSQTKSDYITKKGVAHIASQCRTFILQQTMIK